MYVIGCATAGHWSYNGINSFRKEHIVYLFVQAFSRYTISWKHKYINRNKNSEYLFRNCFTIFEHNLTIALMQYVEEIVQMYFIHIVTTYLYLCRDVESGEARGDVRSQNFRPCGIPAMYYYHVSKYIFDLLNRVCMYTVFLFSSNRDCIRKKTENCTLLLFVFYRSLKNIMP